MSSFFVYLKADKIINISKYSLINSPFNFSVKSYSTKWSSYLSIVFHTFLMKSINCGFSKPKSSKNSSKCFLVINLFKGVEFSVSDNIPYLLNGDALGNMIKFL